MQNRRNGVNSLSRKLLKGLYIDKTAACRDGGKLLGRLLTVSGRQLCDLSIRDCGDASKSKDACSLLSVLSNCCPGLKRFDATNTLHPQSKEVEDAILMLTKCLDLVTINVGGDEENDFIVRLSEKYRQEGVRLPPFQM